MVIIDEKLLSELCQCLAFHSVETRLTCSCMVPALDGDEYRIDEARRLITAAGFNFDELYPVEDRPTILAQG